ncbi:MAG: prepilin-type N-terminal cleavage/methylation domain-containing protein [Nitrospira sp.]|nr:prepilin-type N-terminal cleavage/methylation domain-containing protein [Nitrospira sp.]MCA9467234.1 prepilin-type N-terminal cleavage/methylation domain-containing protein [Nitrospira sp.]MCA9479338.1 prepilin-type N-terminal cleavage/methylation domain-containing protein [Nitrospira sp.]MCB9711760.1 prepilin-type N-terminal cleavage/methylation domain-containing protein [Nitrospiraceae bacterium]HQU27993.1 prepilin-type N-terminal cleavage/methylation domain-containing protein [Nitrospiral
MSIAELQLSNSDRGRANFQRGFSLLEVLVTLVVVFVVLLGFAGFSVVANKGIQASEKMTRAVTLAQEKLEDVHRQGLPSMFSTPVSQVEPYGSIPGAPLHRRTSSIQPHMPMPGLHTVTVEVQWDNDSHRTALQTYMVH